MEKLSIITKVKEPTDWVSSLIVVTKPNGDLRICIDPTHLNKAIKRSHYPLPTIEDILPKLSKAKVFSLLDAKDGFWQVKLTPESSLLTCFNTPFGRYQWNVMPFGIKSAPEEYQCRTHEELEGLEGVEIVADDILVYGTGDTMEAALNDHEIKLRAVLDRCKAKNIKLNKEKLKLRRTSLTYIGHLLTNEGISADPKKIEAILNIPQPTNVTQLKRFLGTVNYLSKFLPNISDHTHSMRELEKKDRLWNWTQKHEKDFQAVKKLVCEAPILKFYDSKEDVTLQCDSSQYGLGAVLL